MRITRTGIAVVVASAALLVGARSFGLVELFVMGVAVAALVIAAAAWVRFRSVDVAVQRIVRPRRVHAGDPSTVEVTIHNRVRTSPILEVHDPVTGTRGADLLVAPQHPGASAKASYRLPTRRRGIVEIGPMTVTISDPFGLWRSTTAVSGRDDVTVLPAVHDINPMGRTIGPDPDSGTHRGSIGQRGDDFAALRSYVVGDDLRRVHWPSSARTEDDLLVRTDDVPWHGRVVVVLDLRRHVHDEAVLEHAVSAAASVVRCHVRRGDHVRLLTSSGYDSGYDSGGTHFGAILERLATVEVGPQGGLHATIEAACHGGSGALVVVSGRPSVEDLAAVDRAAVAVPARRLVTFSGDGLSITAHGTVVVAPQDADSFTSQWARAETVRATGRRAVRR